MLFLASFTGCGAPDRSVKTLSFEREEAAKLAMDGSSIECDVKADCPEFSAAVFGIYRDKDEKEGWGVSVCTGQLISPKRLLTNRHCLPSDLRSAGADCSDGVLVKFPETDSKKSFATYCEKVVHLSETEGEIFEDDWAIIELKDKSNRKYAEINSAGIPDRSVVSAYPAYFSELAKSEAGDYVRVASGLIKKTDCMTDMGNLFSNMYLNPLSLLFTSICDRDIVGGNSGTAILDAEQAILGIISGSAKEDEVVEVLGKEVILQMGTSFGTNMACIPPLAGGTSRESCEFFDTESPIEKGGWNDIKMFGPFYYSAYKASAEAWVETENEYFEFLPTAESEAGQQFLKTYRKGPEAELMKQGGEATFADADILNWNMSSTFPYFPSCVKSGVGDQFEAEVPFAGSILGLQKKSLSVSPFGEIEIPATPYKGTVKAVVRRIEAGHFSLSFPERPNQKASSERWSLFKANEIRCNTDSSLAADSQPCTEASNAQAKLSDAGAVLVSRLGGEVSITLEPCD